jgi:DNA-binding transcriptional ArsR family regulator
VPQDAAIGRNRLKPTQQRVIAALTADGSSELTRAQYEKLAEVSRSQAAYDLAELVEAGILHRVGQGRATRYRLAQESGGHRRWTEERIRAELAEFCAGREAWPSARAFKDAGRGDLYIAASRYGGIAHWTETLGFARVTRPSGSEREAAAAPARSPLRARLAWAGAGALAALGLAAAVAAVAVTLSRQPTSVATPAHSPSPAILRRPVSDESLHPAPRRIVPAKAAAKKAKAQPARPVRRAKAHGAVRAPATTTRPTTVATSYVSSRAVARAPSTASTSSWSAPAPAPSAGPAPLRAPSAGAAPAPLKAP